MLRKMLLQGLVAAAIIAGAAAVYAGTAGGPPQPEFTVTQAAPGTGTDTGYLQLQARQAGKHREDHDRSVRDSRRKDRSYHSDRRHRDHYDD